MKIIVVIGMILIVTNAFAEQFGTYKMKNADYKGELIVKKVSNNQMPFEITFGSERSCVSHLEGKAYYNSKTQTATYTEDKKCPNALTMKFEKKSVVVKEAACSELHYEQCVFDGVYKKVK